MRVVSSKVRWLDTIGFVLMIRKNIDFDEIKTIDKQHCVFYMRSFRSMQTISLDFSENHSTPFKLAAALYSAIISKTHRPKSLSRNYFVLSSTLYRTHHVYTHIPNSTKYMHVYKLKKIHWRIYLRYICIQLNQSHLQTQSHRKLE